MSSCFAGLVLMVFSPQAIAQGAAKPIAAVTAAPSLGRPAPAPARLLAAEPLKADVAIRTVPLRLGTLAPDAFGDWEPVAR